MEKRETFGVSPAMLSLVDELGEERQAPYWGYTFDEHNLEIIEGKQSLWITTRFPEGGHLAMGAAYCPECELTIDEIRQLGNFLVEIHFRQEGRPWLHYRTTFNPIAPLLKLDHIERMNENQGPESTLAFVQSLLEMKRFATENHVPLRVNGKRATSPVVGRYPGTV